MDQTLSKFSSITTVSRRNLNSAFVLGQYHYLKEINLNVKRIFEFISFVVKLTGSSSHY